MKVVTIFKLTIRIISINLILKSIFHFITAGTLIFSLGKHPDAGWMMFGNGSSAIIYLIFGSFLFVSPNKVLKIIGNGFNFEEKIEVINIKTIINGAYCLIGVYLIVFAIPNLVAEIIKVTNSYYGLAINDRETIIYKSSIAYSIVEILLGSLLIKFYKNIPPFNYDEET